ncbi:dihydroneopterin aldolase [Mesobacillus maritimus]|uniref:dihydroneopterin aldolase n=1 Tax=Mesobacillus maritimus TaxID=1643336 RepID=UPI00203D97BF|nr:dihydroneopterin aldolase [Mesobacillus maritimus]MCM3588544.1 dihydroneopterin aldolase [Mesobacillus maritimus]MCM3671561.1 dihydroneopterin aldolase [Mesobacillus maritimus]
MDKIQLNKMEFYGYHGVFPEETKLGQRFAVDLTVELDLSIAGKSDRLEDSINYAELYKLCKEVVEGEPFKLVEAVAENIAAKALERFNMIALCHVKVIKPDPPIPGHYHSVAVEITRGR